MLDKNGKSVSSENTKPTKRKNIEQLHNEAIESIGKKGKGKTKTTVVGQTGKGKTFQNKHYKTLQMEGKKGRGKSYSRQYLKKNGLLKNEIIVDNISKKIEKIAKKNIKNKYSINTTKIASFLKTINKTELGYMNHIVNIACSMNDVIRKYNVTKERFCSDMGIKTSQYNDYIRGSRNYDLKDMAKFNSLTEALIIESTKAKKNDPIKFPK